MIIDIGAGADTSITSFMAASSKNILIVNPEPSSFNDSYQLMRAANFDHKVNNFGVFMNQAISELHGKRMYDRFEAITTKFVEGYNPKYLGSLKNSQKIKNSIVDRKPVVFDPTAFDEINSFKTLAKKLMELNQNENKGIKFFEK